MFDSDSSSSSSSTSKQQPKRRRIIPVMESSLKVKPKSKDIVINLSMTRYEVISDVADQLDWEIQYSSRKGDWDVLWTDHTVDPQTLIKMHFFQKISHFPGIHVLARKNLLGLSFMEMRKKFPDQYNFFPKTWLLPADYPELRQYVEKVNENRDNQCFIVKPEADCQGKGIFLTFKIDQVSNGRHYVVQEYIDRPLLVDGLKFDFRVYVLLCGTSPMRLYIYEEGLARLATQKYTAPSRNNLKKLFMHLTNYAINKKNPKYIYNSSAQNMGTGHKRSMTSVFKDIKRRGLNVEQLKSRMNDVIVKTVVLGQPLVSHQYKFAQPDDASRNMCFHILGIDIMIDEFLNPLVLEVNHTPSFATDSPLDYFIKFNLIKDTLVLMNINKQTKQELLKQTNSYQRERVTNGKRLVETEQKKMAIMEAQKARDQYQNAHLGRYTKIYPVDDREKMEQYESFMKYAEKTYFMENNIIRSQIEQEKKKQKGASKKSITKKSYSDVPAKITHESPVKFVARPVPAHSQSERQIDDLTKAKNTSVQFFKKQTKVSTLLNHPLNIIMSGWQTGMGHSVQKLKSYDPGSGYVKIARSIGEVDPQVSSPTSHQNRINMIKNLPKIQHNPPMKSSTIEVTQNKYTSIRKKKFSENKDDRRSRFSKMGEKRQNLLSGTGAFLAPKVLRFDNYQQEELDSPLLRTKNRGGFGGKEFGSSLGL